MQVIHYLVCCARHVIRHVANASGLVVEDKVTEIFCISDNFCKFFMQ